MKVNFFLISFALHIVILTTPMTRVEKTEDRIIPMTLMVETMNPQAQKSSVPHAPKNRASRSTLRPIEPARTEKAKNSRSLPIAIGASKQAPRRSDANNSLAEEIFAHKLETAQLDDDPVDLSLPLPAQTSRQSQLDAGNVALRQEATVERDYPDLREEKPKAPRQIFHSANYAYTPKPDYPDEARREGWEGTVLFAILVDAEGLPERIVLSRSSGFASLDAAAQETVKRWRFQPARVGSKRVQSWVKVPIIFTLVEVKH